METRVCIRVRKCMCTCVYVYVYVCARVHTCGCTPDLHLFLLTKGNSKLTEPKSIWLKTPRTGSSIRSPQTSRQVKKVGVTISQ